MLHQVALSREEYVLLKLDMVKAFDKLEWPFLLDVIERMGMGGLLSQFMKAGSLQLLFLLCSMEFLPPVFPTNAQSYRDVHYHPSYMFIMAFDVLSLHLQFGYYKKDYSESKLL